MHIARIADGTSIDGQHCEGSWRAIERQVFVRHAGMQMGGELKPGQPRREKELPGVDFAAGEPRDRSIRDVFEDHLFGIGYGARRGRRYLDNIPQSIAAGFAEGVIHLCYALVEPLGCLPQCSLPKERSIRDTVIFLLGDAPLDGDGLPAISRAREFYECFLGHIDAGWLVLFELLLLCLGGVHLGFAYLELQRLHLCGRNETRGNTTRK